MVVLGILEGILGDAQRGFFCDQLDGLHDSVDDLVFDARVFAFGVLADGDDVDVVVERFVALQASARPDVGVQVELLAQGQIQRAMALADGRHERALQADLVAVDRVDGGLWDAETSVGVPHGCHVHCLPLDGNFGNGEDFLHGS